MNLKEKSAHLAWCELVALALGRKNGDIVSPVQKNLFLTRWLATALKQRRFSCEITPDIEWLLKLLCLIEREPALINTLRGILA